MVHVIIACDVMASAHTQHNLHPKKRLLPATYLARANNLESDFKDLSERDEIDDNIAPGHLDKTRHTHDMFTPAQMARGVARRLIPGHR